MRRPRMQILSIAGRTLSALLVLVVVACGGSAPTASPVTVATPEAAFAAVREVTPLFDGIEPLQDDVIGQSATWTARQDGDAWTVEITAGWGDCQAGCIDRHAWTWRVTGTGAVEFIGEQGSPLTQEMIAALQGASAAQGVGGVVVAGPVCPVERPGDPACAPRPVAGATLVVQDGAGGEVARFTTDASGLYRIALEPGAYTLVPSPVEGYMGGAPPVVFEVLARAETWVPVAYDTGIR